MKIIHVDMDQFFAAVEQQPWVELELEFEPWPEA